MNDKRDSDYVLGSEDDEFDRLATQHQIWQAHTAALWERAGFAPGQKLLDAGCGPGFASIDLASLVGRSGQVLGIDDSASFVASATQRAASLGLTQAGFRCADLQTLDLEADSLDGAFLRWVVSFLPRPRPLFERLARALRPGGALVLMDYVNYGSVRMHPGGEVFEALFRAFAEANRRQGGDYDNGGLVPGWVADSGLVIESMRPLVFLARPGDRYWRWFRGFCRVFAPKLPAFGLVDEKFGQRLDDALDRHESDPATFLMTPPVIALIARRPALPRRGG